MIAAYIVGALLVAMGLRLMLSALRATEPVRRIYKHHTRRVSELAEGWGEVAGTIRAVDGALRTLDGKPAAAIQTVLGVEFQRGSKSVTASNTHQALEAGRLELTDSSGTCVLEMDNVVLIGPRYAARYGAADFKNAWPELFAQATSVLEKGTPVRYIDVEQTYLPDGCEGFVSGDTRPDDSAAPGEGYRATRQRLRLAGKGDAPMVVSAFPESVVRSYLGRPALVLGWFAALLLAMGAIVLYVPSWFSRAAGLH